MRSPPNGAPDFLDISAPDADTTVRRSLSGSSRCEKSCPSRLACTTLSKEHVSPDTNTDTTLDRGRSKYDGLVCSDPDTRAQSACLSAKVDSGPRGSFRRHPGNVCPASGALTRAA